MVWTAGISQKFWLIVKKKSDYYLWAGCAPRVWKRWMIFGKKCAPRC